MSLSAGSRLGRYEIVKPLGAGGMGEVYRARDTRLDRDVAIKILPAAVAGDAERLARFEREAKMVAALSHPNILALHDAGTENGTTFAVMELLEGETLRERLANGPLTVRRAVETAIQVARGLAAAHAKGLVHRDLKPENVFLVADGQVKILDFGLAKTAETADAGAATTMQPPAMTDPGTTLGTVGYMAPEQVRGHAVDARTDLFAFGAVLYEMLSGQRAFKRDTAAETMTAILREDPPELTLTQAAQAPALDRIVRHCLEKNPAERFQSARDVAFALESLSSISAPSGAGIAPMQARRLASGALKAVALWLVAVAALTTLWLLWVGPSKSTGASIADVTYQPLTFEEGFVFAARFARDGRQVIYSADWESQPRDIFETSLDNQGVRALGYRGADLLAVAPDGALAILLDGIIPTGNPYHRRGTIARAALTGAAPRRELSDVAFADFTRDGTLAVSRMPTLAEATLEWPQGHAIVTRGFTNYGPLVNPRVAPSGEHIAYFFCDGSCRIKIADKSGKTVAESPPFFDWWGLAWRPDSREVWFAAAAKSGHQCAIYALDLGGRQRLIYRAPGALTLHDISAEGHVLASFDQMNRRLELRESPTAAARDLSWKEGGLLVDVAANGTILFHEEGDSGGPAGSAYVRKPSDPEPLRIADGYGVTLANDGSKALVVSRTRPLQLSVVPIAGLAQPIDIGDAFEGILEAAWLKDGRLLLELRSAGQRPRVFVRPAAGGPLAPLLPEGLHLIGSRLLAPDGQRLAVGAEDGRLMICTVPAAGDASCTPVSGLTLDDLRAGWMVAGWSADSRALFLYRRYSTPIRVERFDIATGRRELHTTVEPLTAAVSGLSYLLVTPSGAVVYNYSRSRSALYAISGLR